MLHNISERDLITVNILFCIANKSGTIRDIWRAEFSTSALQMSRSRRLSEWAFSVSPWFSSKSPYEAFPPREPRRERFLCWSFRVRAWPHRWCSSQHLPAFDSTLECREQHRSSNPEIYGPTTTIFGEKRWRAAAWETYHRSIAIFCRRRWCLKREDNDTTKPPTFSKQEPLLTQVQRISNKCMENFLLIRNWRLAVGAHELAKYPIDTLLCTVNVLLYSFLRASKIMLPMRGYTESSRALNSEFWFWLGFLYYAFDVTLIRVAAPLRRMSLFTPSKPLNFCCLFIPY